MIKLSKTSKLGCMSWSLNVLDTCSGSIGTDGQLVDACKSCYATQGAYIWSTTKAPRDSNKIDWQRPEWVADMVIALAKQTHFRWFDSGDMYSLDLAEKIYAVMLMSPQCKFWLPTRMAKFAKYKDVLARMQALDNVMVRFSSDSVIGEFTAGVHGSTIAMDKDSVPAGAFMCSAPANAGKCGTCRACWSKDVPVVAYIAHGHKIKKVIKIALARDTVTA